MDTLPHSTLDLLKMLEQEYPDKIVTKELSPYEQGKLHGAIELIRSLIDLKEQGENYNG